MPRRTRPRQRRRRLPLEVESWQPTTPEEMARELVNQRLASIAILDRQPQKEDNR